MDDPSGDRRGINRREPDRRLTKSRTLDLTFDPKYRENPHILRWWTAEHDSALRALIEEKGAAWPWHARDRILEVTSTETIEDWRATDPICAQYAWYNVLMYFAGSRAQLPEFPSGEPDDEPKPCAACGEPFIEASLKATQYGSGNREFCPVCLDGFFGPGNDAASADEILAYVRELSETSGRIPAQAFGSMSDANDLDSTDKRSALVAIIAKKPSREAVRREFGSWFGALVAAGLLPDGSQQMARGIRSIALDGHVCLSLGERTICDVLHVAGIAHGREPYYPSSRMRADFLVGDHYIEFLGLAGDATYDEKTQRKIALAERTGLKLTLLTADDLRDLVELERRLLDIAAPTAGGALSS